MMKTISILFSILFLQLYLEKVENTSSITVIVEKIKSDEGTMHFALYTEDSFGKEPLIRTASNIENGTAIVEFKDIPAGTYAVTCFHDKNANNRLDFEATGQPMENYGVSNNIFNLYGPPYWRDAKFEVSGEPVVLKLKLTR